MIYIVFTIGGPIFWGSLIFSGKKMGGVFIIGGNIYSEEYGNYFFKKKNKKNKLIKKIKNKKI